MKKVSIIIPLYNNETNIDRLIYSVRIQSYINLEIILINDGSTDSTFQKCQQYLQIDSRISLYTQKNLGVSMARNYGLEKATGDYITFIDGDDYVEYQYIEKLVDSIDVCGEQDCIAVSTFFIVNSSGEVMDRVFPNKNEVKNTVNYLLNHWHIWGILFPASLVRTIQFDRKIKISEDYKFICEILAHSDFKIYPSSNAIYNYVINDNSAMNSPYSTAFLDGLIAEVEGYEKLQKSGIRNFDSQLISNGAYQFMTRYFNENRENRKTYYNDYLIARKIIFKYATVIRTSSIKEEKKYMIFLSCMLPGVIAVRKKIKNLKQNPNI